MTVRVVGFRTRGLENYLLLLRGLEEVELLVSRRRYMWALEAFRSRPLQSKRFRPSAESKGITVARPGNSPRSIPFVRHYKHTSG